jgi:diguanylate cyclase (GGDEF)-like protein
VPADPFLTVLVLAVAINAVLVLAVGLTALRARGYGLGRPPGATRSGVTERTGRLLLGPDGIGSATYDRVVRVVAWAFIVAVTVIVAASGLWPKTQDSIFVLMAVAAVFMLVIHDLIPDEMLGAARPIVEGSVGITFATLLVVLTGGPSSPFFFAYALIAAGAALVLSPPLTLLVTAVAVGGYLVGVLADPALLPLEVPQLVAVSVNIAALVLLAYVALVVAREQRRSRDIAIEQATVDSLTELYNRAYFFAALDREIQRSARSRRGFCLLMLDLDGLKPINDRFGHFHGDRVLRAVGEVIRHRVRRIDTAGRYGGDEFVVLLPETAPAGAFVLAEKIRAGAAELGIEVDGLRIPVSLSIGVVAYPADGRVADDLMIAADRAMYTSKRRGKNRIVGYGGRGAAATGIAALGERPAGPTRRGPRNAPVRTAR